MLPGWIFSPVLWMRAQLRKVGEAAAVDDQAVEGVADAHAARLGVADHGTSLFEVAVDVEIGVDDAGARFDDRDAGVLADEADQPRPAARDDYVDIAHGAQQRPHGFVPRGEQREGVFVDAFGAERFVQQRRDRLVGMAGVAAPFQDAGVARLDAEREDVGRDIGAGFADHADHAERYAALDDGHAVGARPARQFLALRRAQVRNGLHVGGDGVDAFGGQPQAVEHGRRGGHDQGLNTGGMGNFSPSPFYTKEVDEFCKKYIYQATVDAMKSEGRPFKGVIFFGLMLTPKGPKVLEYNARFGDPEAQVVLPRMKNDIVDVFEACIDGTLDKVDLQFEDNACVCVILASDGYPLAYEKGFEIKGMENFKGKDDYFLFHAGSKFNEEGKVVTNGGRVLGVTALGKDLKEARAKAYEATEWVDFDNKYMRHDIGKAIDEA